MNTRAKANAANNLPFDLIANLAALVIFFAIVYNAIYDPMQVHLWASKDSVDGAGLAEQLTVIVLIPGILIALYGFFRFRNRLEDKKPALWLLMWALACIYFAGEEVSWGQWYFQWDTPETFSAINMQQETNLHNISPWLDQKPQALVEIFIIIVGFLIPLARFFKREPGLSEQALKYWIYGSWGTFSAALVFMLTRIADWTKNGEVLRLIGESEISEFFTALFLSLYMISIVIRMRQLPG